MEKFWNYYYFPETNAKPILTNKVAEKIKNYALSAYEGNKLALNSIISCLEEITTWDIINGG
ncbi:MAG: hypothetical protein KGO96_06955 [Elusimicrobia bacterium]|nr:hypothetical protein [Elusimicrobiota bacterium]